MIRQTDVIGDMRDIKQKKHFPYRFYVVCLRGPKNVNKPGDTMSAMSGQPLKEKFLKKRTKKFNFVFNGKFEQESLELISILLFCSSVRKSNCRCCSIPFKYFFSTFFIVGCSK